MAPLNHAKDGLGSIVMTTVEDFLRWGRSNSLWPLTFGLACCAIEMMSAQDSDYDMARFGSEIFRPTPRQADLMIVAGTVCKRMAPRIKTLFEQMAEPRYVIAMGACTINGGPYQYTYSVVHGVDKIIPVDVHVPGCPPTPEALLQGLIKLQRAIRSREGRPRPVPFSPAELSEASRS